MSKANQAFKHNDEAVSPVIGVILMVAITVVLAAVVFVLVSNLGGDSNTAPVISWNKNESEDTLSVVTASSNADWTNLEIDGDGDFEYSINGNDAAGAAGTEAVTSGTPVQMSDDSLAIRAGDDLVFCVADGDPAVALTITITDPSANQIVKEESFQVATTC